MMNKKKQKYRPSTYTGRHQSKWKYKYTQQVQIHPANKGEKNPNIFIMNCWFL